MARTRREPPRSIARPPHRIGGDSLWVIHDAVSDRLSQAAAVNLTVAMELRATAWALAEGGLRAFRPELSEEAVQAEVRALFRRTSG